MSEQAKQAAPGPPPRKSANSRNSSNAISNPRAKAPVRTSRTPSARSPKTPSPTPPSSPTTPIKTIQAMIAAIDAKLTEQINEIIHHEAFRQLEGTWCGLHYLINNTETDETLKIRVMNISKKDVGKVIKKFKGVAWDQSPLFKQIYESEYGTIGGEPFGCLVGDYSFDHTPPDVEILQGMAQIAASAHAPFLAGARPSS